MCEARQRLALDAEPPDELRGTIAGTQHLERHALPVGPVGAFRPVDVAHAAGPDQRHDAVRSYPRSLREGAIEMGASGGVARKPPFGDEPLLAVVSREHLLDFAPNSLVRPAELAQERVALRPRDVERPLEDRRDPVPDLPIQLGAHDRLPHARQIHRYASTGGLLHPPEDAEVLLHFLPEPRSRCPLVALHRFRRNAKERGGLLEGEPSEEAVLHDFAPSSVDALEPRQRLVERHELVGFFIAESFLRFVERHDLRACPSLQAPAAARLIYEHTPHRRRHEGEKPGSLVGPELREPCQAEVRLVHQPRGLQRVAGALASEARVGDATQLVVVAGDEVIDRRTGVVRHDAACPVPARDDAIPSKAAAPCLILEDVMRTDRRFVLWSTLVVVGTAAVAVACQDERTAAPTAVSHDPNAAARGVADPHGPHSRQATTLYVWGSDVAGVAPDFLTVIEFDRKSPDYGKVLKTVPLPPPGNTGNEPHHCHTSIDQRILACGGLLSVLKGQNDIFFFDITTARDPKFLFSTCAPNSSITDDFVPLPSGGFLVTNMGSATGGAGGRVVEFDRNLQLVGEYPTTLPADGGFNPHGIDVDFSKNLMVTSDFVNPVTTLNVWPGPVELRGSIRFWNLNERRITRTVSLPDAAGTMDVKFSPGDPRGRAGTANMFTGLVYTVDPTDGSYVQSFDCETIEPHIEVPVRGGMTQLLAMPRSGRRMIFGSFQAGQVGMLDITNPNEFKQVSVVNLGVDTGPHSIHLTHDDKRLI